MQEALFSMLLEAGSYKSSQPVDNVTLNDASDKPLPPID